MKVRTLAAFTALLVVAAPILAQDMSGLRGMQDYNKSYFKHHKNTSTRSQTRVKMPKIKTRAPQFKL
jgi:hypothetical protein